MIVGHDEDGCPGVAGGVAAWRSPELGRVWPFEQRRLPVRGMRGSRRPLHDAVLGPAFEPAVFKKKRIDASHRSVVSRTSMIGPKNLNL